MAEQVFTVKSGFFNAVNGDRTYTADDMNKPYSRVVSDGVFAQNDGTPSSDMQVTASGTTLRVTVQAGQAIVGAKWFENPAAIIIDVPGNTSLYGRIDSVVMRVNKKTSGRNGSVAYITGTPSAAPVAPDLSSDPEIIEYRVANIAVAAGATAITGADVTDLRGSSSCPWVTGLIQQVDTSTLWEQFNAAYMAQYAQYTSDFETYMAIQKQAFEDWLATLTEQLTVAPNVLSYRSEGSVSGGALTDININIASYDKATDVLFVFLNGLQARESIDYTISADSSKITLTTALEDGGEYSFLVLKAIVTGDLASTVSLIMALEAKVDAMMADSGWEELTNLGTNVAAYATGSTPYVRKIGSTVFIEGAVQGIKSGTILTLPVAYRPTRDHYFAIKGGAVKIAASTGVMSIVGGAISSTSTIIPIGTSFGA